MFPVSSDATTPAPQSAPAPGAAAKTLACCAPAGLTGRASSHSPSVPAMRVLLEVCRRQALLNGLDQPQVLHIGSPGDTAPQGHTPTLREVLPPELAGDARAVREQALVLHRALPIRNIEQLSTNT
jgi:hypothetical protein